MSGMWAMMAFGVVVWVLVIVALVAGIIWLMRRSPASRSDRAFEILRERYARGEITREEYEARRRDLAA